MSALHNCVSSGRGLYVHSRTLTGPTEPSPFVRTQETSRRALPLPQDLEH